MSSGLTPSVGREILALIGFQLAGNLISIADKKYAKEYQKQGYFNSIEFLDSEAQNNYMQNETLHLLANIKQTEQGVKKTSYGTTSFILNYLQIQNVNASTHAVST